jgi:hypothetical protein
MKFCKKMELTVSFQSPETQFCSLVPRETENFKIFRIYVKKILKRF